MDILERFESVNKDQFNEKDVIVDRLLNNNYIDASPRISGDKIFWYRYNER